jgi:flagellar protein FliO/FliZ
MQHIVKPGRFALAMAAVFFSTRASAQAVQTVANPSSSTGGMLQMIFGLAIVLAVILAAAWILRRIGMPHVGGNQLLKPIGTLALGTRERIVVVEIEDQWLVLGVAPGRINTLHTLAKGNTEAAAVPGGSDTAFALKLREILRRSGK